MKKLLIGLALLAVIAIGFFILNKKEANTPSVPETVTEQTETANTNAVSSSTDVRLGDVHFQIPASLKAERISNSSVRVAVGNSSADIIIEACTENSLGCFGSGIRMTAPTAIKNGRLFYNVSTSTMAAFGLELGKDDTEPRYFSVNADFGNHEMSNEEYKQIEEIIITAKQH